MNQFLKKFTGAILLALVLIVSSLSILSIWEVIVIEDVLWKATKTMFVLFLAAAVCLFIFAILFKGEQDQKSSGS